MKVRYIASFGVFLVASLLAAAPAAQAQVVVTVGTGMAHDCFLHAKAGVNLLEGVQVCNGALDHDPLNKKDRAGTFDNRGVLLDLMGRTQAAADDFNASIALDPSLGDPYVNLGAMLTPAVKGSMKRPLSQINKRYDLGHGLSPYRLLRPRRGRADAGPLQGSLL